MPAWKILLIVIGSICCILNIAMIVCRIFQMHEIRKRLKKCKEDN